MELDYRVVSVILKAIRNRQDPVIAVTSYIAVRMLSEAARSRMMSGAVEMPSGRRCEAVALYIAVMMLSETVRMLPGAAECHQESSVVCYRMYRRESGSLGYLVFIYGNVKVTAIQTC